MPDSESRTIVSRREAFREANKWFESFLESNDVRPDVRWDLLLVFEEIVCNVIEHAYTDRDDGPIHISVEIDDENVRLTVCDEGRTFDPLQRARPDLDAPGPRAIGGLGVHLVRSLCDEVLYQRSGESNILTVRKVLN